MLIYVPLNHIDDNPYQRRAEYGDIEELADRIHAAKASYPETLGLMQVPRGRVVVVDTDIIVDNEKVKMFTGKDGRWNEDPKTFRIQLAFGHRRMRAFEYLNRFGEKYDGDYYYMPVHIDPLTDKQMLDAVWAENYERKDISAVEQAELIKLKLDQLGPDATHAAIGTEWGLSRPVISNRLRLLELPEEVQAANRDGRLSERQALALKPIVEIDQLVNGRVEWGQHINSTWGMPAGAKTVIKTVLAKPEAFTSDDLRSHARKMAENAGRILPDCIARHTYEETPGIEQPQCKGCKFRVDQRCLNVPCLVQKRELWTEIVVEQFSQESGIPISEDGDDLSNDYQTAKHIRALYEAGVTDGMVCAWSEERPAARATTDYVHHYEFFDEDGRGGIALGWRGQLPPLPASGDEETAAPRYEVPPPDTVKGWADEEAKIARAAKRALLTAVADALSYQVAEFDLIQFFMNKEDAEWVYETDKIAKQFAEFLFNKGARATWYQTFLSEVQAYQAMTDKLGMQINVLGDNAEAARKTAVLILGHWYSRHDGWNWENFARETLAHIAAWEQLPGAAASPMAEHIVRAKRHIEQKIAAEGEAEKERRAERDRILRDPTSATIDELSAAGDELMDEVIGELVAEGLLPDETAVSPTNDTPAVAWLRAYVDDSGRTWQDLEPNQTHHANSPCFQAFTRAFPDEAEPKWQLKQARAVLEQEAAVSVEVEA